MDAKCLFNLVAKIFVIFLLLKFLSAIGLKLAGLVPSLHFFKRRAILVLHKVLGNFPSFFELRSILSTSGARMLQNVL